MGHDNIRNILDQIEIVVHYDESEPLDENGKRLPPVFQPRNRDELKQSINAAGLGHCWDTLEATIKDDILIVPTLIDEATLTLGVSKMGGLPDLPLGWDWPRSKKEIPLGFVTQINCTEASLHDRNSLLPKTGILYFFAAGEGEWEEHGQYGYDNDDGDLFRVLFFDGDSSSLNRVPLPTCEKHEEKRQEYLYSMKERGHKPDPEYLASYRMTGLYPCCSLKFFASCTPLTFWESPLRQNVFKGDDDERYLQVLYLDRLYKPFKLLGNPDCPEHELEEFCIQAAGLKGNEPEAEEVRKNKADWIMLFQVASNDVTKMMWGSCGTLFYIIRKQDLVEKRFDKIWAMIQW